VLTASISLTGRAYADNSARALFWKRMLERIRALPGVTSAAISDSRPPAQAGQQNNFDLEDRPTPPGQSQPVCAWVGVSPDFFRTAGLPLERGRPLDDRSLAENVVVVDRAWANRFFPGGEVLGRRFRSGGCTTCPWTTVVGVVANVKWTGLEATDDGTVYFPFVDFPIGFAVLRTSGDPAMLSLPLQRAIHELDPSLAVSDMATGDELVSEALATARYVSVLIAMFASTALVLSVVGIFGVVAYFVQQHARDIGIRLALGGTPARVRRMILFQGMRLVVAGVAVGVGAAVAASRFMGTIVFGVSATDPRMLAGVPAVLVAVALVACLAPAQRAARLDPADVLRDS
jgi:predicted permease